MDSLFQLSSKVDANDDVATLLRTTKRFVGSSRMVPSDHLEIQKLSQFSLSEDNGRVVKNRRKVCFTTWVTTRRRSGLSVSTVPSRCFWCTIGRAMSIYIQSKTEFQAVVRCCISTSFTCSKLDGRAETRMFLLLTAPQTSFELQK